MAISVTFGVTTDDAIKLEKNVTVIKTVDTCELLDGTIITDPVIRVRRDEALLPVNYLIIPRFNRKYTVTAVELSGVDMIITAHVDVLASRADQIRRLTAIIERSESAYNRMLTDDMIPVSARRVTQVKELTGGENISCEDIRDTDPIYCISVVGGVEGGTV